MAADDVFAPDEEDAGASGSTAPPPGPRTARLRDLLGEWQTEATAAYEAAQSGRLRGPVTRFSKLDSALGGALNDGIHSLQGVPGSGKTALALQLAATCGFPALYLSAEMSLLELFRRHIARTTGTFLNRLRTGELPPVQAMELAGKAVTEAPDLTLADATLAPARVDWIRDRAKDARGGAAKVLLVIDSLHSWAEISMPDLDEYQRLNMAISGLRKISAELACPVLVVTERNRVGMEKSGLHAGAGTRKIEYGVESLWDLKIAEKAENDAAGEKPITLILEKNRNGAPNVKVDLKFHGALQRFRQTE
jgi:replicative DNA helicase